MFKKISFDNMMYSIVPISCFDNGEVNKIFDDVNKNGCKIVVKNNKPICVLISPKDYQELIEIIEDCKLYIEANKRIGKATNKDFISSDKVLSDLGITKEELK